MNQYTSHFPAKAQQEKPEEFFKGKIIELIPQGAAVTGTDLMARAFQPFLKEYTGATVVVKAMPGAGGLECDNYVWRAKPNGLTIGLGTFSVSVLFDLLDDPGSLSQIDKLGYLGCIGKERDKRLNRSHNPKVASSNLAPATKHIKGLWYMLSPLMPSVSNEEISCLTCSDGGTLFMAWAPFYPASTGHGIWMILERIPHALLFLQEFYDITV
jgi:hypothetical protein